MSSITAPPTTWEAAELEGYAAAYPDVAGVNVTALSKYNPTPGTGRTGFLAVAPNNYPFYSEDEKYVPIVQADGGQLSEWEPMYNPTNEQAEKDRARAYATGIPHGFVPPGDRYAGQGTVKLRVVSELHDDDEYGSEVVESKGPDGTTTRSHRGGPFYISVSPKMRVEDLRQEIYRVGGIIPALQKLSYAGKNFEDAQRTLEHYGVAYWHRRFPEWPIKVRRY